MLSKELTEMHERLTERDDEICELKAERNNTRVSHISMLYLCSYAGKLGSTLFRFEHHYNYNLS